MKKLKSIFSRVALICSGFLGTEVVNNGFDFILYPLVIGFLGPITGGIIMTILALVLNYGLLVAYRKTGKDWFGFEWLALKREQEGHGSGSRVFRALLKLGHWPAFVFLSWEDPFKAFVYIRGDKQRGIKFTKVDWAWFIGTNILGNLIWVLIVWGVLDSLKALF